MRLLNTSTLDFHEFYDSNIPEYAILSHRWGPEEASFQDLERNLHQKERSPPFAPQKVKDPFEGHEGFAKIKNCCALALKDGFEWVWIDTCCIDKKSSAELTEAINSMYAWYEDATVCYAYLVDVELQANLDMTMPQIQASSWFTRGWTLQELLAPGKVQFFDKTWAYLGNRDEMAHHISDITGIEAQYLLPAPQLRSIPHKRCTKAVDCTGHPPYSRLATSGRWEPSVATRMSWASRRETSRTEDMAYCLLGIFHVNMPLLYGEGMKAFTRLQHEIIKQSNDDSIFAWTADQEFTGILAKWPSNFANSRYVHEEAPIRTDRRPYAITNQGLELPVTLRKRPQADTKLQFQANHTTEDIQVMLDCGVCGPQGFKNIVLSLYQMRGSSWGRCRSYEIETVEYGPWHTPQDPSLQIPGIMSQSNREAEDDVKEIFIRDEWTYTTIHHDLGKINDPLSQKARAASLAKDRRRAGPARTLTTRHG